MSDRAVEESDRNQRVDRAGYPRAELDALRATAEARFETKIEEHGPGKNWLGYEPRGDIFKACDELFQARDPAQDGDYETAQDHLADALNHMGFVLENVKDMEESDG